MSLTGEQKKKLELLALEAQYRQRLNLAFDADHILSRPTPKQMEIIKSEKNIHYVVASNRAGKCIVKGTLVATPKGPVPIENLRPGDKVYDEHGKVCNVKHLFDQGMKDVVDLTHRGVVQATCTLDHKWLVQDEYGRQKERAVKDFHRGDKIVRKELDIHFGEKSVEAYALGALLGDGCSKADGRRLVISSGSAHIPQAITASAVKFKNNYSWSLGRIEVPFYKEWCHDRYAHEKIVDIDEVRTWDRESILKLLAGLIDTDGSMEYNEKYNLLQVRICMQSKSCIEFVKWAIESMYQYNLNIGVDNRSKYKNGPCYVLSCRNTSIVKRLWKDIDPYLNTPHKKYKKQYEWARASRYNPNAVGVKVVNPRKMHCYDIEVNTDTHLYCLANGLVTHNSQLGARILSWWFDESHPYQKRPDKWGNGPLTMLLVGRVGEQIDSELWANKVEKFLKPGTYKVIKSGNSISRIEHKDNGNKIIFISHHDADQARQKAQAYTAQVVWLDEMPTKVGILNELRMRVLDSNGFLYCTFTPLVRNQEIRKVVDRPSKRSVKWFISVMDNPKFTEEEKKDLIDEYRASSASEAEFEARMLGKWLTADTAVFTYDSERNWAKLPDGYDPHLWPHVAVVDPAVSGTAGLTVYAREPRRDVWYCVMAKYVKGDAFSKMVPYIESILEPFNITKRICDCNPSGFYVEAQTQGITYVPVTEKSFNKENMIDAANAALAQNIVYLSPGSEILADELMFCARSEENPERIIKSSKYHTADTFRYFIHLKPKFKEVEAEPRPEERVRKQWKEKLQNDGKRAIMEQKKLARTTFRSMRARNRRRAL